MLKFDYADCTSYAEDRWLLELVWEFTGRYQRSKKTPVHRDIEEEDNGTHWNFPEGMRNHSIPSRTQQALSLFPEVGVNKEVEYFYSV
jgi:hypothetical protein